MMQTSDTDRRFETPPARRGRRGYGRRVALLVAALVGLVACGSSTPEGVIDRETFIQAYVDLRVAALDTDSSRLAAADRERILDDLGITGEDLLDFVRAHAAELEYMREVWNEVELRLDRSPGLADEEG